MGWDKGAGWNVHPDCGLGKAAVYAEAATEPAKHAAVVAVRGTAGLGAADAAAALVVHVQDRAGEMMAAAGQPDHGPEGGIATGAHGSSRAAEQNYGSSHGSWDSMCGSRAAGEKMGHSPACALVLR